MSAPKVAVIFYSATGNTHALAEQVAEGARSAGAEVRIKRVRELAPESAIAQNEAWKGYYESTREFPEASLEDLEWADAIILGTPSRYGGAASQLRQFIDTTGGLWFQGKLANKVASAFATASNPHGGQEATILSLNNTFYHWGSIIVPAGYTDQTIFAAGGNPYGASATGNPNEKEQAAARFLGGRVAEAARWVTLGRNAARR